MANRFVAVPTANAPPAGSGMMQLMKLFAGVAVVLLVAACGNVTKSGAVEAACETNIRSTLLNPETAEFHEFRPLTDADFQSSVATAFGHTPGSSEARIVEGTLTRIRQMADTVGADLYIVRTRAEGRLGNRITDNFICMADPNSDSNCQCFPAR